MNFILVGLLVMVGVALQAGAANAQIAPIVLDGSLGPRGPLMGPLHFTIGADPGQIRGHNLFHSFARFNIPTSGSATFTGPNSITNIVSRVTGRNEPSSIDGLLRSTIPGANFFLLNPSGVVFGAQATLDVKGSFHASTADYLRFADNQRFYATLSHESTLTAAAPAAFGFLAPSTARIEIGNAQHGAPTLSVPEGQVLSFVGGAVSIRGTQGQTLALGGGDIEITGASVTAPGGEIRLVAGAGPSLGEAGLAAPNGLLQLRSFTTSGEVTLRPAAANPTGRIDVAAGTSIDVSGDSGGTVAIRGGHLLIDNSTIRANTSGAAPGAPRAIDIQIADDVTLTQGASIQSAAVSPSTDAGDLTIDARSLSLTGGARIASGDFLDASQFMFSHGGNVWINATDGITIAGSGSVVSSMTRSAATGGRLTITDHAGSLTLTDHGANRTTTRSPATGSGGDITIDVGRLFLNSSGQMGTEVQNPLGRSGRIAINAADSIAISGPMTSVFSTGANGGGMTVSAPFITLEDHLRLKLAARTPSPPSSSSMSGI